MTSLYDFGQAMQAQIDHVTELLESGIEAESDEVQNALKAIFATKEEFSDKAEKVGLFIINTLAEAAIAKGEADRLTKIAKAKIAKAEPKPAQPNLNDIDVMTPQLDYMPDAKADLILIASVIVLGLLAVASWIVW